VIFLMSFVNWVEIDALKLLSFVTDASGLDGNGFGRVLAHKKSGESGKMGAQGFNGRGLRGGRWKWVKARPACTRLWLRTETVTRGARRGHPA
jgi:hypothetical protein